MKIPKSVIIGGFKYRVEYRNGLVGTKGQELVGEINYSKQIIFIDPDRHEQLQQSTFIHECLHGLYHSIGGEEPDEDKIEILEHAIFRFLIENSKLGIVS